MSDRGSPVAPVDERPVLEARSPTSHGSACRCPDCFVVVVRDLIAGRRRRRATILGRGRG